MAEVKSNESLQKAKSFFKRAGSVAQTGNFDYAIETYIDGLRHAPDALQLGHIPLRNLALARHKENGKKPSVVEKVRNIHGKTPLDRMLKAEYLLAKDPENMTYAQAMLKAAVDPPYEKTAKWIADLVFMLNNSRKKPSVSTYMLLKECYKRLSLYDRALVACEKASKLKPHDADLAEDYKNLSAELAVVKGKYDQAGDFRKSIKDRQAQRRLHAAQSAAKSADYRQEVIEYARKNYQQDPTSDKNINELANSLTELDTSESDQQAIGVLEKAYEQTQNFSFKKRAHELQIRMIRRRLRHIKKELEKDPQNTQLNLKRTELLEKLKKLELLHYRQCLENYPTDLAIKYEYAVRLLQNKQYDQAIPLFQEAQKDPRRKIISMTKIGLCFFQKGWYADAVDLFNQAIEQYEIKDDALAKDLRYNLARAHEQQQNFDKALELYRKLAQLDFAYKDVKKRVDNLRNKQ